MSPEWVKLKTEKFGVMEQKHKRERPHREWADDIEDWGEDTLQKLYHLVHDRLGVSKVVKRPIRVNAVCIHV